jgi:hypothetical protein
MNFPPGFRSKRNFITLGAPAPHGVSSRHFDAFALFAALLNFSVRTATVLSNYAKEVAMSIARVTEIKSSSTKSFDDAVRTGLARANKTLKNVKSAWIQNQEVLLDDSGKVAEYRVQMKVTFVLDD